MKHCFEIRSDELHLRPLEERDIEALRNWRNNPAMTRFLTKLPYITQEMQENWFHRYLSDETEVTLAIDYIGGGQAELIGSIALSEVTSEKAECGKFMIGNTNYKGRGLGRKSLSLCLKLAFEKMKLHACDAHAHPLNSASLVAFVNEGFQIIGSRAFSNDEFEYAMELSADRYQQLNGGVR